MTRRNVKRLALRIVLGTAVVGLLAAGIGYWIIFGSNTADFDGGRSVYIDRDASLESVVDSLVLAGVLADPTRFTAVARATGWGSQIKAGHYRFDEGQSTYSILQTLRRGLQAPVRVVIPPGSRPEVVAAVVAREMEFSPDDFLAALADDSLASELGTDTLHLFGYMLPETYNFYWLNDATTVVRRVKEFADKLIKDADTKDVHGLDLSPDEVITMASIVEWESDLNEEKPTIAGVYMNRLRDGWRLDADPTIQFAVLEREGQKRRLYFRDYDIDHPYNTYTKGGLPPGPVTNPSPTSIRAVLAPGDHRFYFFVAYGDGSHVFSRTLREHNRAAAEYRRRLRERANSTG